MMNLKLERKTVTLPDGYNGHTIEVYLYPVLRENKTTVDLQVSEPGKEYLFKVVSKSEYKRLTEGVVTNER